MWNASFFIFLIYLKFLNLHFISLLEELYEEDEDAYESLLSSFSDALDTASSNSTSLSVADLLNNLAASYNYSADIADIGVFQSSQQMQEGISAYQQTMRGGQSPMQLQGMDVDHNVVADVLSEIFEDITGSEAA